MNLLFFIYNDRAFILIVDKNSKIVYNEVVDLLTFDAVKRTHFYEDNLRVKNFLMNFIILN
jgi:hypothetical protein